MNYAHYCELADLLDFPRAEFADRGRALLGLLRTDYRDAAAEVEQFLHAIPQDVVDLQELHTRTFDVQSLTTLDLGYVMFGDDYKRGELLSNLTREHAQAENDCRGELADHLPNVLRLIPKLKDRDLVGELVREIVAPALALMIREFEPERIEKKTASYRKHFKTVIDPAQGCDPVAYRLALQAVLDVIEKDFQLDEATTRRRDPHRRPQTMDFLRLVEREIEIEGNANPVNSGCDA